MIHTCTQPPSPVIEFWQSFRAPQKGTGRFRRGTQKRAKILNLNSSIIALFECQGNSLSTKAQLGSLPTRECRTVSELRNRDTSISQVRLLKAFLSDSPPSLTDLKLLSWNSCVRASELQELWKSLPFSIWAEFIEFAWFKGKAILFFFVITWKEL